MNNDYPINKHEQQFNLIIPSTPKIKINDNHQLRTMLEFIIEKLIQVNLALWSLNNAKPYLLNSFRQKFD